MKLIDLLEVIRESTRIQLIDEKGNYLTAPLHKREITNEYNEQDVMNICARYSAHGHSIKFHLAITISK